MRLRSFIQTLREAIQTVSKQDTMDRQMFGPVYHGSSAENHAEIMKNGFIVDNRLRRNGYPAQPYQPGGDIPAPLHHLGFGIYFTTVRSIAKQYNGGSVKGLKEFYLDIPNREEINFGSPNTMMRWWVQQGYDYHPVPREQMYAEQFRATTSLTNHLKSQFDAVWYKGKGMYRLLDGDQVCVYDPSRIYMVDPKLAKDMDIGSKVVHNQTIYDDYGTTKLEQVPEHGWIALTRTDVNNGNGYRPVLKRIPPPGMKGIIVGRREIGPQQRQYLPVRAQNQAQYMYDVKWAKGGVQHNYLDGELDPAR
jgi:hypothetical protein